MKSRHTTILSGRLGAFQWIHGAIKAWRITTHKTIRVGGNFLPKPHLAVLSPPHLHIAHRSPALEAMLLDRWNFDQAAVPEGEIVVPSPGLRPRTPKPVSR